jgi:hypothetical protein
MPFVSIETAAETSAFAAMSDFIRADLGLDLSHRVIRRVALCETLDSGCEHRDLLGERAGLSLKRSEVSLVGAQALGDHMGAQLDRGARRVVFGACTKLGLAWFRPPLHPRQVWGRSELWASIRGHTLPPLRRSIPSGQLALLSTPSSGPRIRTRAPVGRPIRSDAGCLPDRRPDEGRRAEIVRFEQ